jgi:hypothetical protein
MIFRQLLLFSLVWLLVACMPAPAAPATTSTPGPPTYEITKQTIMLVKPDVEARVLHTLSKGLRLTPADGSGTLECTMILWGGEDVEVCKLEIELVGVEDLVASGWVPRSAMRLLP